MLSLSLQQARLIGLNLPIKIVEDFVTQWAGRRSPLTVRTITAGRFNSASKGQRPQSLLDIGQSGHSPAVENGGCLASYPRRVKAPDVLPEREPPKTV